MRANVPATRLEPRAWLLLQLDSRIAFQVAVVAIATNIMSNLVSVATERFGLAKYSHSNDKSKPISIEKQNTLNVILK